MTTYSEAVDAIDAEPRSRKYGAADGDYWDYGGYVTADGEIMSATQGEKYRAALAALAQEEADS